MTIASVINLVGGFVMKKFDRLPPEKRKEEIKNAAVGLFIEKGFAATTMENIVERISLSKGGLYRIYPSLTAILSDIIIDGMRKRNEWYVERITEEVKKGEKITMQFMAELICESLLIFPEMSAVYVEFLCEKRRNKDLQNIYPKIVETAIEETSVLINEFGADEFFAEGRFPFELITDIMDTAILGISILDLHEPFEKNKKILSEVIVDIIKRMSIQK